MESWYASGDELKEVKECGGRNSDRQRGEGAEAIWVGAIGRTAVERETRVAGGRLESQA